ncbi:unnamed protein product [Brachionus calyciflorus]|uniref:EGF-like domain-containing protein n=1 Tax=Brachionus calyciflorus TaxID=104777 RepID=A0A814CXC1_9BILA|nr:unnamed protein product [Brachionus calyciflorus]
MFQNLLILSFLASILNLSMAKIYVSGSSDMQIKIWNDSSLMISRNISQRITCMDVDLMSYFVIVGTEKGKVINWQLESNSTISDNGNEITEVKSLLVLNSSYCLAGYNGSVIFLSLADLRQIQKISDTRFGNIIEMKNLSSENIVLIINKQKNIIVFSLINNTILRVNLVNEEGSFDILNRSLIFAPCVVAYGGDICLFNLKNDYSLSNTNLQDLAIWITFPALKILNESFGIYSSYDKFFLKSQFGFVNFKTTLYTAKFTNINKILSLDSLNDYIIAGHENGSISHFNKDDLKLIKTFIGHSAGFSTRVVKKFRDISLIQNKFSTLNTNTALKTEITTYSSEFTTKIYQTGITSSFITTIQTTALSKISRAETSSLLSNLQHLTIESNFTTGITKNTDNTFYTELNNQINQSFSIFTENTNEFLKILNSKIDLNDCISNCSGNGFCKLDDNKYVCECFRNYAGSKCELNILPCFSNPCRNNGQCINNYKSYTCKCFSEKNQSSLYYGKNCENKVDLCENEKCSDNGVCFDSGKLAKCKCFPFYSGIKCEIQTSEIQIYKCVIRTSSILAIIILIMTYLLMIFCDLINLLNRKGIKNKKYLSNRRSTKNITKLKYIN